MWNLPGSHLHPIEAGLWSLILYPVSQAVSIKKVKVALIGLLMTIFFALVSCQLNGKARERGLVCLVRRATGRVSPSKFFRF